MKGGIVDAKELGWMKRFFSLDATSLLCLRMTDYRTGKWSWVHSLNKIFSASGLNTHLYNPQALSANTKDYILDEVLLDRWWPPSGSAGTALSHCLHGVVSKPPLANALGVQENVKKSLFVSKEMAQIHLPWHTSENLRSNLPQNKIRSLSGRPLA